jgi:hypothetical protein
MSILLRKYFIEAFIFESDNYSGSEKCAAVRCDRTGEARYSRIAMHRVNSRSDIVAGDWSSIGPYQSFVDESHPVRKYDGPDLRCDPTRRASHATAPLSHVMGPESTGIEGLYIATCGRMTFAPAASQQLASVVHGSDAGPVIMRPFVEKIDLATVRMVTPPPWALGGAIERSQGVPYQDCGTRIVVRESLDQKADEPTQSHLD